MISYKSVIQYDTIHDIIYDIIYDITHDIIDI